MENCIKFKLATDAVLKGERSDFIAYLLDRNRSPLPIADVRCSIDIRHIHARGSTTNMITTRLYTELPLAPRVPPCPFIRLRFRYLIFYCPFNADAYHGVQRRLNTLAFRHFTYPLTFRWYYSEMLTIWKYRDDIKISLLMFQLFDPAINTLSARSILEGKVSKLDMKSRLNLFLLINSIFLCS